MSILMMILSILAAIIAILLIISAFMKRDYTTHSEILVDVAPEQAFDYIKRIKNQDNYNKWLMMDPGMKKEFKGTDGTVGFVYAWNGNKKGGEGEQEIMAINEGKNIVMEIRFVRPFAGVAHASMTTEQEPNGQTKIIWNTSSSMKYPMNLMLPMITKMLEKDMGESMVTLKKLLEKRS